MTRTFEQSFPFPGLRLRYCFKVFFAHLALKPTPISNVTSDHHMAEMWTTQHDKGWLKSYKNIFSFSNTITCDKTDSYLRWVKWEQAFRLFVSLRNLTTIVQGLTLATLSTIWKQLWCYENFPAVTINPWHVLKINEMSYINCLTLIALII